MDNEVKQVLKTNSGMWAIWQPERFNQITDYSSWENELLEDENIVEKIREKVFVPININSDGTFEFLVRMGEDVGLTEREKRVALVTSKDYLIKSNGILITIPLAHGMSSI